MTRLEGRESRDAGDSADYRLLRPGETCWRVSRAGRAALLMDNAAYFSSARRAIEQARHSVWLVGWTFDPRTTLEPDGAEDSYIGNLLNRAAEANPDLRVRLLIWDAAALVSVTKGLMPQRARRWFRSGKVAYRLDSSSAFGAALHQKLLVVDDALAFCSGADFSTNRWDSRQHLDVDPRRRNAAGLIMPPRHTTTLLLDGPVARQLGTLVRERWRLVTGESVLPAPATRDTDETGLWPAGVAVDFRDLPAGISRTQPDWRSGEVREGEALFLEAIAAARRRIYLESQYLTSVAVREALARSLIEPDGPEVVLIGPRHSPNLFDRAVMDTPRSLFFRRLCDVDRHKRLRAFMPHARKGRPLLVHSKLMIVDDRWLRVGSSNLSNRSMGYDAECDVTLDAGRDAAAMNRLRDIQHELIGHFLDLPAERVAAEAEAAGSLGAAVERLDPDERRLRRLEPLALRRRSPLSRLHLGDPYGTADAWRPWKRLRDG